MTKQNVLEALNERYQHASMASVKDVRNMIEALQDDGEAVAQASWISVADSLPEEDVDVILVTKSKNGSRNVDKGRWDGERWIRRGTAEVTHWMAIPVLPEG